MQPKKMLTALAALFISTTTMAAPAYWTEWTSIGQTAPIVQGTLNIGANAVGVTYTGSYSFAQINDSGFNYWQNTPAVYSSAAATGAPTRADIIALNGGGSKTITFSQSVHNPLIGLVSWNNNTVDFGAPIQVLSNGTGFWGGGTPIVNGGGTGFFGSGEVHGVIQLIGDFTSFTFIDTTENWHGITIGALDVSSTGQVPEPGALALLGLALAGLATVRRR